jgi:hypothetical protein
MNTKYEPPLMPDYPATLDELLKVFAPYYHDQRPLDLFFEFFVIDVLGALPTSTDNAINQLVAKFPFFFASANGNWREGVVLDLNLSDTIKIAILDLWLINSSKAKESGWFYHPWHYAKDFLDNYTVDGSRVDVWEGNALELAKARIEAHRVDS